MLKGDVANKMLQADWSISSQWSERSVYQWDCWKSIINSDVMDATPIHDADGG